MAAEMIEIVNQRFEARQKQLKQQQDLEELFAMGNRPGLEKRIAEQKKMQQEKEWKSVQSCFWKCLWILTIVLLACDAVMAGVLIWAMLWGQV